MLPTDTILTPQAFASAEEPARSLSLRRGVGLALFGSGFASLVYQVIWQRVLTQEIGVDAVSVAVGVAVLQARRRSEVGQHARDIREGDGQVAIPIALASSH